MATRLLIWHKETVAGLSASATVAYVTDVEDVWYSTSQFEVVTDSVKDGPSSDSAEDALRWR
jgi:hypothetical protein